MANNFKALLLTYKLFNIILYNPARITQRILLYEVAHAPELNNIHAKSIAPKPNMIPRDKGKRYRMNYY